MIRPGLLGRLLPAAVVALLGGVKVPEILTPPPEMLGAHKHSSHHNGRTLSPKAWAIKKRLRQLASHSRMRNLKGW